MSLNRAYVKKGGKVFDIPINELVRYRASSHEHATKAEFQAQQNRLAGETEAAAQTQQPAPAGGGNKGSESQGALAGLKSFFAKHFQGEGDTLDKATDAELIAAAGDLGIENCAVMARPDLIEAIRETRLERQPLEDKTTRELKEIAKGLEVKNYGSMTKDDLLIEIPLARDKKAQAIA